MTKTKYQRTLDQLHDAAAMFWPAELSQQEAEVSIIPKLIETQDQFIAILSVETASHDQMFEIVNASTMPPNLFLKHLSVLSDVGGEQLQRYNREFKQLFPDGVLRYIRDQRVHSYKFQLLPISGALNNDRIGISGKKLLTTRPLDTLFKDVAAILMFGSACENADTAEILSKCEIGNFVGNPEKLATFVKQRYIIVSRITSGARTNTLGQVAQRFVREYLMEKLPEYDFSKKRIPGIVQNQADDGTSFDVVISNRRKYVAVEVSFQVTTNSVIERKSGQARSRFEQIEAQGYKIAYVLDGAGNFQRVNAVSNICDYSHCTVAFTRPELDVLAQFVKDYFEGN